MRIRLAALIGTIVIVAAACATTDGGDAAASPDDGGVTSSTAATTSSATTSGAAVQDFPEGPSALDDMFDDAFPDPLIDPGQVISGGPPPDGIPAIDEPKFLPVADNLEILPANEPVVSFELNGDARAYPVRALVWHEIVNDVVGGVPVAVTYCPLCNSAAAYERTIDGAETTFGTSGRLFNSALVMYDRATESLWTHYDGRAVIGVLTGAELVEHPAPLLAWGDFREAYPTGQVLDWTQTGYDRDYGRNPYTGYDDPENTPFLFRGAVDERASAMTRVVGIDLEGVSVAYSLDVVSGDGEGMATNIDLGGTPLAIFWKSGQATALDDSTVAGGRDVGSVAVFASTLDGRVLTFTHDGEAFVDDETGSTWTITGAAIAGALEGAQLEQVPHLDTFWFAWSTYQPETSFVKGE